MNSKEALEILIYFVNGTGNKEKNIYYKTIKQDLDRLETFDYIAEQNVELREENAKLKKVIEILKEAFQFDCKDYKKGEFKHKHGILFTLHNELLKEVLGND